MLIATTTGPHFLNFIFVKNMHYFNNKFNCLIILYHQGSTRELKQFNFRKRMGEKAFFFRNYKNKSSNVEIIKRINQIKFEKLTKSAL